VLGYALTYPLPLMQSAAVFGIYGLTLIAVLVFALPPVLWGEAPAGIAGRRTRIAALAIALAPLAVAALLGQVRLTLAPQAMVPDVKIRIVQPSVPQREKWRPENQQRIFLDHMALSAANAAGEVDNLAGITAVIWPEAAMPFLPLPLSRRARRHRPYAAAHDPSHHRCASRRAGAARLAPAAAHFQQPHRLR
jgi:apolipoprotein N-acyltransferase